MALVMASQSWAAKIESVSFDSETKDVLLRNQLKLHTDDARKRAILVKALVNADSIAKLNPHLQADPSARQEMYNHYLERAKADAAMSLWKGGWLEIGTRATSA